MKDDTISRRAALDALGERPMLWVDDDNYTLGARNQYDSNRLAIETVPSVDAVPVVHGQWIIKDNPGTGWYRVTCSECGEDVTSVAPVIGFFPKAKVTWDFCPNCGARMDGDT
jgi:rRNA maturation protein Nop10